MNFKEGDVVEIRNENIKVLTPVTFINGKELIFFAENSYDTKTHCLRIKVGDHFQSFLNCQIKKGSKKEYVDARLKELMKEEIKGEPNVLYSTLTFVLWWRIAKRYLELKRQAKRDYKKKMIYWLRHEQ